MDLRGPIIAKDYPGISNETVIVESQPKLAAVFPGSVGCYPVYDVEELA